MCMLSGAKKLMIFCVCVCRASVTFLNGQVCARDVAVKLIKFDISFEGFV